MTSPAPSATLDTDCSKARSESRALLQADSHVHKYRAFRQAYGTLEGFYLAKARIAAGRAEQMQTAEGRAWIAKMNAKHAEWRAAK